MFDLTTAMLMLGGWLLVGVLLESYAAYRVNEAEGRPPGSPRDMRVAAAFIICWPLLAAVLAFGYLMRNQH